MDYLCYKVEEAAGDIARSSDPLRKAFGAHLKKVAKALHDIEWVDSSDYGDGDEREAIEAVIGKHAELEQLLRDAKDIRDRLEKALEAAK